jgi:hypothetical protein
MKQEHSIFKAIVIVENQHDCNIAREICERYELPMWKDVDRAFDYVNYNDDDPTYFQYQAKEGASDDDHIGFYVDNLDDKDEDDYNIISIQEFESLAEDYNPQYKSVDDILTKLKELNNLLNNK